MYERAGRILGSEEGGNEDGQRGLTEGENTAEKTTSKGERRSTCWREERERRTGSNVADYRPDPVGRLRSGNPFYRRAVSPATRRSTQRRRCDRCDGGTSASHDSVLALPSVSLFRSYNASECYLTSSSPVIHYIIYTYYNIYIYTHTHTFDYIYIRTRTYNTYTDRQTRICIRTSIYLSVYHFLLSNLSFSFSLCPSVSLALISLR